MRIWHEQLIPKLCQKHLCAMWRESLGAYSIITNNKKGYRQHPAVKEFENYPGLLWNRLVVVRNEMLSRGYNPKEMPDIKFDFIDGIKTVGYKEWQSLDEQIAILRAKGCDCKV